MYRKNRIRLNESQLRRIVKESVKRVLLEGKNINNKPFFKKYDDNGTFRDVYPHEFAYDGDEMHTLFHYVMPQLKALAQEYEETENVEILKKIGEILRTKGDEIHQAAVKHNLRAIEHEKTHQIKTRTEPNLFLKAQQRKNQY